MIPFSSIWVIGKGERRIGAENENESARLMVDLEEVSGLEAQEDKK